MNKKKNYISFAEQSRRLIKKYSRASFDPSEKAELEEALAALAQEQEAYKQANQIGEYSPEAIAQKQAEQQAMQLQQMEQMQSQSHQGIPQDDPQMMQQQQGQPHGMIPSEMAMGGQLPWFDGESGSSMLPIAQPKYGFNTTGPDTSGAFMRFGNNGLTVGGVKQGTAQGQRVLPTEKTFFANSPETTIGQTQGYLPTMIGGAASLLGNVGMALSAKPGQIPDAVKYSANYAAPEISLAKERERLARNATEARNVAQYNARGAGSRGAYLGATGVANAGINQQLSDSLSSSYFKEGMTNLDQQNKAMQENNRIRLMNQEAANQQRMMQFAENQRAKDEQRQYIASAIGNIGNIVGDFNKIGMNNANIESLGSKDYNVVGATGNKTKNWMLGRTIKGKVRK